MTNMTNKEHKERHVLLHNHLDELIADFIRHTKHRLTEASIMTLVHWSYCETRNPKEADSNEGKTSNPKM